MDARAQILITGLVQGVLFRKEMMDKARSLGVTGWVRNLPDGRVEASFEGDKSRVEELIRFSHLGPPGARVTGVDVQWSEYKGEFRGFRIVH